MKFGVENRNVNFQRELPERILSTHLPAVCSVLRVVAIVKAAVSAQHTQSSRAKLTCSSTAAWLSPILLPNSTKSSITPACPVPCPRPRQRQAPRAKPDCCSTALVAKLICDADFLGDAPSKFTCEPKAGGYAVRKRRPGGKYLSVTVSADGIQMREVCIYNAHVKSRAGVRTLPSSELPESLCRSKADQRIWRQADPRQPRCDAAAAVLGET